MSSLTAFKSKFPKSWGDRRWDCTRTGVIVVRVLRETITLPRIINHPPAGLLHTLTTASRSHCDAAHVNSPLVVPAASATLPQVFYASVRAYIKLTGSLGPVAYVSDTHPLHDKFVRSDPRLQNDALGALPTHAWTKKQTKIQSKDEHQSKHKGVQASSAFTETPHAQCLRIGDDEITRCGQPATKGHPKPDRCKVHHKQCHIMYKKYKDASKDVDKAKHGAELPTQ